MSSSDQRGIFYHPWSEHNYFNADITAAFRDMDSDDSESESEFVPSHNWAEVKTYAPSFGKLVPEESANEGFPTEPIDKIEIKEEVIDTEESDMLKSFSLDDLTVHLQELAVLSQDQFETTNEQKAEDDLKLPQVEVKVENDQSETANKQNDEDDLKIPHSELKIENDQSEAKKELNDEDDFKIPHSELIIENEECETRYEEEDDLKILHSELKIEEDELEPQIALEQEVPDQSEETLILINDEMVKEEAEVEPEAAMEESLPAFNLVIPPGCKSKFTVIVKNPQDPNCKLLVFSVQASDSPSDDKTNEDGLALSASSELNNKNSTNDPSLSSSSELDDKNSTNDPSLSSSSELDDKNSTNDPPLSGSSDLNDKNSTNDLRATKRKISDPETGPSSENASSAAAIPSALDHTYSTFHSASSHPLSKRPRLLTEHGIFDHMRWLDFVRKDLESIRKVDSVRQMEFKLERARLHRARLEAEFSRLKAEHELELANLKLRNARRLARLKENLGYSLQGLSLSTTFDWLDKLDFV
ncbi:hypothetical protein C0J52_00618 [Blattella germanica]|nr:hypothetical protein C0J52_00618 [Blattella germanica]